MATAAMPQPNPDQGATPPPDQSQSQDQGQGGQQPASSFQAPANPLQMLLAKWSKVAEQMAAADPRLASGAQKIREGIQDMQTAMITPQSPMPMSQQPK